MKKLLLVLTISFMVTSVTACKTISQPKPKFVIKKVTAEERKRKKEEYLQKLNTLGCVSLDQVDGTAQPPNLFMGTNSCIKSGEFLKAGHLYHFGRLYGTFDARRVADKSSRQAVAIMPMLASEGVQRTVLNEFNSYINKPETKSAIFKTVCKESKRIGPPKYYPEYMINHGLGAIFRGKEETGLIKDFDTESIWSNLRSQLCNYDPVKYAKKKAKKNLDRSQKKDQASAPNLKNQ